MNSTVSVVLYLSWPIFIIVSYLFVRYNIKKLEE